MSIYRNPIMQQVEKYCKNGFFPICKMRNDRYVIFTPFIDKKGFFENHIRRTNFFKSIDNIDTWDNKMHTNNDYQPTEIVGFYHLPTPKFEIGDKVKVREDVELAFMEFVGRVGTIKNINSADSYFVDFGSAQASLNIHDLEPYLKKNKNKQFK